MNTWKKPDSPGKKAQATVLDMINSKPKLLDRKRTSDGGERTPNSRSPLGSAEPDSSSFRPKIESVRMQKNLSSMQ